jgi:hypothetical protein
MTVLLSARTQARDGFNKNRSLESSSKEATEAVAHAEGVAQVLRHNIVQGKQEEGEDVLSMSSSDVWNWIGRLIDTSDRTPHSQRH